MAKKYILIYDQDQKKEVIRMWERWNASTQPLKQLSILQYLPTPGGEDRRYTRVYENVAGEDLTKTDEVLIFIQTDDVFFADTTTSHSYEFTSRLDDNCWGFKFLPLSDPGLLEDVLAALHDISGYRCTYDLYTSGGRVAVVRSVNPEYTPQVAEKLIVTAAESQSIVCHGGQPHVFGKDKFVINDGGRIPPFQFRICTRCGCPICINMASG